MNADRRHARRPTLGRLRRWLRLPLEAGRPVMRWARSRRGAPRRPVLAHSAPRQATVWQRLAWAVSAATALTLVALGAQTGKNAACAASAVQAARADSGEASARGGDCSLSGALLGDLVAAVSADEYAGSAACGAYLDVTGPGGTVRVQVVDECLSCEPGELDLSRAAFARIAGPERGVVHVSYHTVHNPEVPRPVAFRLKKGSSSRWLAIQAVDHGNPLRRLEILKDGRWRALSRDSDNYWVAHGIGDGPYTVRITDVYGQRLIATGIDLTPEQFQRTTRRLYAPATASPVPPFLPSAGKTAPGTAGGTAPRAATGNRDTQPRATGTGGPTTGTMTGASGGTEPGTRESKSTETGTTGSGGNGSGSTTSPGAEAGSASAGVSGPWGTGPGVTGPEGHAARGTLDIDPTGGPRPDPDRAPFTALPSARPFFC